MTTAAVSINRQGEPGTNANSSQQTRRNRRRPKRSKPVDARVVLSPQELDQLWAAYLADRSNVRRRNRLVEHYQPWIRQLAMLLARRLHLEDEENAVGEALAALVAHVIPDYDGMTSFHNWATVCTRRKLLSIWRAERRAEAVFVGPLRGQRKVPLGKLLPNREQRGGDLNFLELTLHLSDQEAAVLWLRFYRGMPVKAVAAMLKVSESSVTTWMLAAVKQLKKTWSNCMPGDLHAY